MKTAEDLLAKMGSGDKDAFNEFYIRYSLKVRNYVMRFVRSNDEAEDLTQDIFIHLWMNRGKIGAINNADAFLSTVSRNMVLKVVKKKAAGIAYLEMSSVESDVVQVSNSVEDHIDFNESAGLTREAIERLPPQTRKVFELSRNEGLSCDAISRKLHISRNTVKYHIKTSLRLIRKHFEIHSPDTVLSICLLPGAALFLGWG